MDENLTKIEKYLFDNEKFTLPQLQKQFNLTYAEVKEVIDVLTGRGLVEFDSGLEYKFDTVKAQKAQITEHKSFNCPDGDSDGKFRSDASDERRSAFDRLHHFFDHIKPTGYHGDDDDDGDEDDEEGEDEEDDDYDDDIAEIDNLFEELDDALNSDGEDDKGEENAEEEPPANPNPASVEIPHLYAAVSFAVKKGKVTANSLMNGLGIEYIIAYRLIRTMLNLMYIRKLDDSDIYVPTIHARVYLYEHRPKPASNEDNGGDKEEAKPNTGVTYNGVHSLSEFIKKRGGAGKDTCSQEYIDRVGEAVKGTSYGFEKRGYDYYFGEINLKFSNGDPAMIQLSDGSDGKAYFSDNRLAYKALLMKPGYGRIRARNTLKKCVEGSFVKLTADNTLTIDVDRPEEIARLYYLFYWLIESVIG